MTKLEQLQAAHDHMLACRALLNTPDDELLFSSIKELQSQLSQWQECARELHKFLDSDALWGITGKHCPIELETRYASNVGSLTSGPNNCKKAYEQGKKATALFTQLTSTTTGEKE